MNCAKCIKVRTTAIRTIRTTSKYGQMARSIPSLVVVSERLWRPRCWTRTHYHLRIQGVRKSLVRAVFISKAIGDRRVNFKNSFSVKILFLKNLFWSRGDPRTRRPRILGFIDLHIRQRTFAFPSSSYFRGYSSPQTLSFADASLTTVSTSYNLASANPRFYVPPRFLQRASEGHASGAVLVGVRFFFLVRLISRAPCTRRVSRVVCTRSCGRRRTHTR